MKTLLKKEYIRDAILLLISVNLGVIIFLAILGYPNRLPDADRRLIDAQPFILAICVYSILFYHYFTHPLLLRIKFSKAILPLISLCAAFYLLDVLAMNIILFFRTQPFEGYYGSMPTLFRWVIAVCFAFVYSLIKGIGWLRIRKIEAEKENINASLQNLRAQIEPHFIFNTLNYVYALSLEEKATKTSQSIEELSNLFRYTLRDSRVQKIPIENELQFLEQYIRLNKNRIQENGSTSITDRVKWDNKQALIAPLLLINFIENAFKHGISVNKHSAIKIDISVQDNLFRMEVTNSMHQNITENLDSLGLENTRKRLQILYPGKHELKEKVDNLEYKVDLTIILN